MKEKLFVLSMDAMIHEDVAYLETKPNFSRLMRERAEVERVRTIYPSITYPAHTSISTGCRPGRHGVIANASFKTVDDGVAHYFLYADMVRVEDIFTAARRAGCTTAAVYWPITGNHPDIDWLIDEYFFPDSNEDILEGFAKLGANEQTLEAVRENLHRYPTTYYNKLVRQTGYLAKTDTYDDFINGCACSLIRRYQPDFMMIHNCFLDNARHFGGVFHPMLRAALDEMDLWLGELMQAMEDAGVYEDTNFVILSDHGQMNYNRRVNPNVALVNAGLIQLTEDGEVATWDAFAQSNGKSATVYLHEPDNRQIYHAVHECLDVLRREGYIEDYFTREEVKNMYGLDGSFAFMIEPDDDTAFGDGWTGNLAEEYHWCTHGYRPEKGPQPVFLGRGPAFRPGAVLPYAHITDDAPTLARILGAQLPQAEGRCLSELLLR